LKREGAKNAKRAEPLAWRVHFEAGAGLFATLACFAVKYSRPEGRDERICDSPSS
jgi:hypothetical protein